MKHSYIFVLLFFIPFFTAAQNVVLSACNEIKNSSSRNQCLEASLENLLIKEVFRNLDLVNLQHDEPVNMSVGINVGKTGIFSVSSISTPNFGLARSIHNVLKTIHPLGEYKGERRSANSSTFEFDFDFILKSNNDIAVLNKEKDTIFIKTFNIEETKEILKEEEENKELASNKTSDTKKLLNENEDVAFAIIEEVPIFPGCEGLSTNQERKECMSGFVDAMVRNNFNTDLPSILGLSGRHRIAVQFKINTHGFITDVVARAPHPALEEEAIRVINTLPRFTPGKQRGKTVNVMYSLPILFQVEGPNTKKK